MVKQPAESTGAVFGECWSTSTCTYKGLIMGFIVIKKQGVAVSPGESESEELLI